MEYIAHSFEHKGHKVEVIQEEWQEDFNPRKNYDNASTFFCAHRNYILGDEQVDDPETFLEGLVGLDFDDEYGDRLEAVWQWLCDRYDNVYGEPLEDGKTSPFNYERIEEAARAKFAKLVEAKLGDYVIRPLYLYDHSGITINTGGFSCPWDSGQVGYAVIDPDTLQKEWDGDRDKALACLEAEVETYARYLEGQVYFIRILGPVDPEAEEGLEEESREEIEESGIGGFIGYPDSDWIVDEAKALIA